MTKRETLLEKQDQKLFNFMGLGDSYRRPASKWTKSDAKKNLVLSDPHEPYGNEGVYRVVETQHKDADTLIIPGDLSDYYSRSRFRKTRHVKFSDELRATFLRLEWLATHWKRVFIMMGNHDNRPEKQIAQLFDGNVELQIMTEQNLLTRLASYFDNVEVVGTQLDSTDVYLTHIWQYGDIIFTHAEKSMAQKSALMGKISEQLHRWTPRLNLKPFKVIAQGHNHTAMKQVMGGETWFLLPTASNPESIGFEYIYSPRMIGDPPCVGYSIMYQDRGETDTNNSNFYLI